MKKKFLVLQVLCAVILLLGTKGIVNASPVNFGFETGDFTGWNLNVPVGGSAQVVTGFTSYGSTAYTAPEGSYFAELKTDGPGSFTTVSQNVFLGGGGTVSGFAAFDARDFLPFNDNAYVNILSGGTIIATPWSASVSTVGDFGETPWQSWSWTASFAGTYTIKYGISNVGDSILDSYALFDGVSTPEPSSLLLAIIAVFSVLVINRRFQKNNV